MVIKHKKTVDKQVVGRVQKHLDSAREFAAAEMKELRAKREAVGAKKGEGRIGGYHRDAVMKAIMEYGPDVMTPAAQSFWDDQKRMYPEMSADGVIPGTDSLNGRRNKYGKVKEKWIAGKWYHWDASTGGWVEGEVTPRKGIK